MRRLLLILLLVFQPLQWGWATVHAAADSAHAVAHGHASTEPATLEIVPTCELGHGGDGGHCHDNHTHHLTVLALGRSDAVACCPPATAKLASTHGEPPASPALARIERPKWPTTPAVVGL